MDKSRGAVERITYANEEKGYSVLKIKCKSFAELVTELDICSLLWIKSCNSTCNSTCNANGNIPFLKLTENARACLEPTDEIREKYFEQIEKFSQNGDFTEEDAAACRQLIYEDSSGIMEKIEGDPSKIEKLQPRQISAHSRNYYLNDFHHQHKTLIDHLYSEKNQKAERIYKLAYHSIIVFFIILFIALGALTLMDMIFQSFDTKNKSRMLFSVVGFLLSLIGLIDTLTGKVHFVKKIAKLLSNKISKFFEQRECDKIENIINNKRNEWESAK